MIGVADFILQVGDLLDCWQGLLLVSVLGDEEK